MKVITAVEDINNFSDASCFLAGGITNCPEWQDEIINKLNHIKEGVLLNPRRKNFPIEDPNASKEQIKWEFDALAKADAFSMWFCSADSDQPICMYELGRHLAIRDFNGQLDKVCIGVEPGYRRERDVIIQTALISPKIKITNNLDDHAKNIATIIKKVTNENLNKIW